MLNKIGAQDFEAHEAKLIEKFREIYKELKPEEWPEFVRAIALRLISRAKTCRSTGHIFGKLFKSMTNVDFEVTNANSLKDLVLQQCKSFIMQIPQQLSTESEEFYEIQSQFKQVTQFIAFAVK